MTSLCFRTVNGSLVLSRQVEDARRPRDRYFDIARLPRVLSDRFAAGQPDIPWIEGAPQSALSASPLYLRVALNDDALASPRPQNAAPFVLVADDPETGEVRRLYMMNKTRAEMIEKHGPASLTAGKPIDWLGYRILEKKIDLSYLEEEAEELRREIARMEEDRTATLVQDDRASSPEM